MKKQLNLFFALLTFALVLHSCGGGEEGIDLNMIPVKTETGEIYVNQKGKEVLADASPNPYYDGLTKYWDSETDLYGYKNKKGKVAIDPQFTNADNFHEGIAFVTRKNGHPEAINTKGKSLFVLEGISSVDNFSEEFAIYEIYDQEGYRNYGAVNKKGKTVIEPTRNKIGSFSQGKASYQDSDSYKYGYIDTKGKIIINAQFDEANYFQKNGYASVEMGDKQGIINTKGEYVINPRYDMIAPDGDWFFLVEDRKVGWCDKDGKYIINPQFNGAYTFHESDLALVYNGKKWGYINKKGLVEIPYQFDKATPFIDNNMAIVEINGSYGFIDKNGKYIVNPIYKNVSSSITRYLMNPKVIETTYSDFFDTDKLLSSVNALISNEYIDGDLRFPSIETVLKKYNLPESKFSKYNKTKVLLKEGQINGDVSYKLYVEEYPWKRIQQGWSYNYVLDKNYQVNNYILVYTLGYNKTNKITEITNDIIRNFGTSTRPDFQAGQISYDYDNYKSMSIFYSGRDITIKVNLSQPAESNLKAAENIDPAGGLSISMYPDAPCSSGGSFTLTIKNGKPFDDKEKPFIIESKYKKGDKGGINIYEAPKIKGNDYIYEISTSIPDEEECISYQTLSVTDASGAVKTLEYYIECCP